MRTLPIPSWPGLLSLAGLLLCVSPVTAQESPLSAQPQLTPDVRARLSEAAQNPTLAPWQREFMVGIARGGQAGVTGDGRVEPGCATVDGSWFQERGALGGQHGTTAIYDPLDGGIRGLRWRVPQ